mmetsp:Transcript_10866/g.26277  ORF Transcript_10866/g.26277 Transcript_10866/m.26277 type:complete len:613 (-) Transcript_10866:900-2738(-)
MVELVGKKLQGKAAIWCQSTRRRGAIHSFQRGLRMQQQATRLTAAFVDLICIHIHSFIHPSIIETLLHLTETTMCKPTKSPVFVYKGGSQKVPKDVTRVKIDPSCKKIERSAFARCKKLVDVEFSEGLEQIGFSAFYCCSSLEFIRLASTTRIIGNMAFAGCTKLKDVEFNDGLGQIKVEAFSRCSSLEEVTLPKSVGLVGKNAFAKCEELATVSLAEGLVRIDDGAFSNSNKLDVLKIPATVESVGQNIVPETTKQEILQKSATPESENAVDTVEKEADGATEKAEAASATEEEKTDNATPKKTWSMTSLVTSALSPSWKAKKKNSASKAAVPSPDLTTDHDSVFVYRGGDQKVPKDVARVKIDPSVKKIERSVFARCKKLTDVEFSEGLVEIGFSAFYYCSSLTLVRLPPTTEVIGNMAFLGCTGLEEVAVPSTVLYVGKSAFANCPKLGTVTVSEDGNLSNSEKLDVIKQILSTTGDEEKVKTDPVLEEGDDDSCVPEALKGFVADFDSKLEADLSAIMGDDATAEAEETARLNAEEEAKQQAFEEEQTEIEEAARLQAEAEEAARMKAEQEVKQRELEAEQRRLEEAARLQAEAEEAERAKAGEEAKQ